MTKRIVSLLLVAAMSFTLFAGCGKKEEAEPQFGADLEAFYTKMMEAAAEAPMMMPAEGEMLDAFYPGLSSIELKQSVIYMPAITSVGMEFAFVEVADSANVEAVKKIMEERVTAQINGGAWYPETTRQWEENSEVVVIDNYVCLFVAEGKDGIVEAFRSGSDVPAWGMVSGGEELPEAGMEDMPAFDPEMEEVPAYDPEMEETQQEESATEQPAISETPAVDSASVDLAAFYEKLYAELYPNDENGDPTGPFVMDIAEMPEMLDGYYPGLSALGLKQMHVYMPGMSGVPYELAMVEAADAAGAEAVKAIFESRIETESNNQMAYPMVIENWELNSRVVVNGNFVLMAVSADCDTYVERFNALF